MLAGSLPTPPNNLHLDMRPFTLLCKAQCKSGQSGKFQVKMSSRSQLNKLFGRTFAYSVRTTCSGVTSETKIPVLVGRNGSLTASRVSVRILKK